MGVITHITHMVTISNDHNINNLLWRTNYKLNTFSEYFVVHILYMGIEKNNESNKAIWMSNINDFFTIFLAWSIAR